MQAAAECLSRAGTVWTRHMVDEGTRQARQALVLHHMAVEESGDVDAVISTFAVPRYDIVASETVFDGVERVRRRIEDLAGAMPGCRIVATAIHHAETAVIVETQTTGLHTAVLLGVQPSGRPYSIRGVAIFRFRGRELIEETVYFDRKTIIDQLLS